MMNNALRVVSSGEGDDVILLHGLFGQGSNLRGIARALEPHFRVHCFDLPDHGRSLWLASASLAAYADEVMAWMNSNQMGQSHIIGHSLGGKVAMQLALTSASRVKRVVVADIAPVRYPGQHAEILDVMARVQASGCRTRGAVEAILTEVIPEPSVRGYLMMSLTDSDEGYDWRFNLAGLAAGYDRLRAAPACDSPSRVPALFLRGAESHYITAKHLSAIRRWFPQSQVFTVAGAGHWLHIDQPGAVHEAIQQFLLDQVAQENV
jgi:esterase